MKYEFHVGDYVACSINGKIDTSYVREYNGTIFSGTLGGGRLRNE